MSGMKHIETNSYDVKRLLHVKGKKRVTAKEVSTATAGHVAGQGRGLGVGLALHFEASFRWR